MFEVKFADIGEGIHEGVVHQIPIGLGDKVEDGDTLYMVETDKVTADIPSEIDGIVREILVTEGQTIYVGDVVMIIDDGKENQGTAQEPVSHHEIVTEEGSTSVVGDLEVSSDLIPASTETQVESSLTRKVLATPVARKMAKDLGLDIQAIPGTGPAGRIMKADIKTFADHKRESSKAPKVLHNKLPVDGDERVTMSQMRKTIAHHMSQSKFTIPHTAVMDELLVDDLVAYKHQAKDLLGQRGIKLTYMALVVRAVVVSLKNHRIMNSQLSQEEDEIILKQGIHIGIAVDTPEGLTVPVIKDADRLSVIGLANAIEDLGRRAQSKQLTLEEITGSTFTITNYGAFGSSFGVPVINYPNAAILGIGKITKKPVVKGESIEVGHVLPLSMAFDHRIMDGADAGRFLQTLKELLMNPQLLLLS